MQCHPHGRVPESSELGVREERLSNQLKIKKYSAVLVSAGVENAEVTSTTSNKTREAKFLQFTDSYQSVLQRCAVLLSKCRHIFEQPTRCFIAPYHLGNGQP
ncbi:unnamed protein product [Polarella glacialis]|uniref:Uncharacterized protein n=1 Tax=Polarella glacialis TaxID=89957 RepID=A0A813HW31_POLGL|nr:unnamed protein product [Polarella glacialis]